jgi:peptidoglycan/LPS O-acetylase OafA/YrhL
MNPLASEPEATAGATPGSFTLGHRRSLDGIRGLAIILVVLSHAAPRALGGGFVGVDLFFVLSGFLISSLLLEENGEAGRVSLKAFYARRALRLLPALGVMLLSTVVLSSIVEPPWKAAEFRTSVVMTLCYVANWYSVAREYPSPDLAHTWSLSVEEQFDIVWPVLLILMLRLNATKSARIGMVTAAILAVAAYRAFLWTTSGSWVR